MQGAVVDAAERHGPFVADLAAHGPRLGEAEMVSLTRGASADEAGEGRHEAAVRWVAQALWPGDRQHRLVDNSLRLRRRFELDEPLAIEPLKHLGVMAPLRRPKRWADDAELFDRAGVA